MLHYDVGAVDVIVKQSDTSIATQVPLLTGVLLGDPIGFTLSDDGDGRLTFMATNDGHTATVDTPLPPFFACKQVHVRTGAYQQATPRAQLRSTMAPR